MLTKVAYVTVFVSDQDRALEFYTNVLGFEKQADNPTPDGTRFLTVALAGQDLHLVLWPGTPGKAKPASRPTPGTCILTTNDCRAAFTTLKSRGVKFETPDVLEQPWAYVATFEDPDGNRLMLRENRPARA